MKNDINTCKNNITHIKHIDYLLQTRYNTNANTLTTRLYSNISSGDLDSVANTLADIKDILPKGEV